MYRRRFVPNGTCFAEHNYYDSLWRRSFDRSWIAAVNYPLPLIKAIAPFADNLSNDERRTLRVPRLNFHGNAWISSAVTLLCRCWISVSLSTILSVIGIAIFWSANQSAFYVSICRYFEKTFIEVSADLTSEMLVFRARDVGTYGDAKLVANFQCHIFIEKLCVKASWVHRFHLSMHICHLCKEGASSS